MGRVGIFFRLLYAKEFLVGYAQHLRKIYKFNICYKSFACFNPLNGIFINIQTGKL